MPKVLTFNTPGRALINITDDICAAVRSAAAKDGVVHLFIQHTSASLTVQENADPDVLTDLIAHFDRLAPEGADYRHSAEGPDDMPAHIKSALTATSLTVPMANGDLLLGTWQGIYLFEHRQRPHSRRVVMTILASE